MHLIIYSITFLISIFVLLSIVKFEYGELPCHYLDSINITSGTQQADESITFDGITFTKDQYATVDYVLKKGVARQIVKPYIRGCVCNRKSCVRSCCPHGTYHENGSCRSHNDVRLLETQVLDENMQTKSMILDSQFAYVNDRPCLERYVADEFQITNTGSIWIEGHYLTHRRYCLNPKPDNEQNDKLIIDAYVCKDAITYAKEPEQPLAEGMMLSVPFVLATILVYTILPELHNFYGKCLIFHLISLTFGYAILGVTHLNIDSSVIPEYLEYVAYFSFISSFTWISIICFELYLNIRSPDRINKTSEIKRFVSYILCVLCLSLFLTVVISMIDSQLPYMHSDSGMKTCFLDFKNHTQCSYYYIPIWIIFVMNQIFFTLITFRIQRTKHSNRETARQAVVLLMASRELHPNEIHDDENFALYLRLHLVICLTWIFKGLALLEANKLVIYSNVSYVFQGLMIFVLFVMNRHVLHIIDQRWQRFVGKTETIAKNDSNA